MIYYYILIAASGLILHWLVEMQSAMKACKQANKIFSFSYFIQDKWTSIGISIFSLVILFVVIDTNAAAKYAIEGLPTVFHLDRVIVAIAGYCNSDLWFALVRIYKMVFKIKR